MLFLDDKLQADHVPQQSSAEHVCKVIEKEILASVPLLVEGFAVLFMFEGFADVAGWKVLGLDVEVQGLAFFDDYASILAANITVFHGFVRASLQWEADQKVHAPSAVHQQVEINFAVIVVDNEANIIDLHVLGVVLANLLARPNSEEPILA